MKITKEILEDARKWYLERNSIRKIAKLIEEGKRYILSKKGRDFIEFYEKVLKKNQG